MPETRAEKSEYLARHKMELVFDRGCEKCGKGKDIWDLGFEKYWHDNSYDSRRFVFKYTDKRGSDMPVAKLPRSKNSTFHSIDEALSRCVILCRSCADPRRTRKEITQCQELPTTTLQPDS